MPRATKKLSPEQEKEIWERYTAQNEKLKNITDEMGVTYNQGRETIRRFRHGIRSHLPEKQAARNAEIVAAKMDANQIREEALQDLTDLCNKLDPTTDAMPFVQAIKTKLQIADSIDRAEGRGVARTQINIFQFNLKTLEEKMNKILGWVIDNCPDGKQDELQRFLEALDEEYRAKEIVSEIKAGEKIIDAEYQIVGETSG